MKKAFLLLFCFTALVANAQNDTLYTTYGSKFIGEITALQNDTLFFVGTEDFAAYKTGQPVAIKKAAIQSLYSITFNSINPTKQKISDDLAVHKSLQQLVNVNGRYISINAPTSSVVVRKADSIYKANRPASFYITRGANRQLSALLVGIGGSIIGGLITSVSASNGKTPYFGYTFLGITGALALGMQIGGISDYSNAGKLLDQGKIGSYK